MKRYLLLIPFLSLSFCVLAAPKPQQLSPEVSRVVSEAAKVQAGDSLQPFRALEDLVRQCLDKPELRAQVVAGLEHLLESSCTFEARQFACKQLGIIGSTPALPAITPLLAKDETAGIGCLALSTYPPGPADKALLSALPQSSAMARIQIVNALGDRRYAKAISELSRMAVSADRPLAEAAISALGKMGTKSALEILSRLRIEAPPELKPSVTRAALVCADRLVADGQTRTAQTAYEILLAAREPIYVRRAALAALLRLDKDQGAARIHGILLGTDAALKPVAITAIAGLPQKEATRKFAVELPLLEAQEQAWVLSALAARGDAEAVKTINLAIGSSDPLVRRAAIESAAVLRKAESAPMLIAALSTCDQAEDRRAIESALINLHGGTMTDADLARALDGCSGVARAHLVNVIATRQGPAANALLFREGEGADPMVAKTAFRALARSAGPSELPRLLRDVAEIRMRDVQSEAESVTRAALAKSDKEWRSQLLVDAINDTKRTDDKVALMVLLPACGDPRARNAAEKGLSNAQERVRTAAIEALAEWPDDSAWDALAGVLNNGQPGPDRTTAFRGLVRTASEQNPKPTSALVERYRMLFGYAQGDADLKLLLGTLGGAAHPAAIQLAMSYLGNPAVHTEAEAAVKRIVEGIKKDHPKEAEAALQQLAPKK